MSGRDQPHEQESRGREQARALLHAAPEEVALPDFVALEVALEREIAQERGTGASLRALRTPLRYALILFVFAGVGALTFVVRPRLDLAVYPPLRMALVLSVVAALVLASVVIALWPLVWRPLPRSLRTLPIALGPLALALLYSLPAAHSAHPASLQAEGAVALLTRAAPCLLIGSAVAAGTFLLLRTFDRGALRVSLLLAACAGLYANFLLQLHCSVTAPAHMLLGHLGVALLTLGWVWLYDRFTASEP